MERKLKRVNQSDRVLKLPTGLKRIVGKKKKLYDEVSVGDWVLDNETGDEAVILEKLPGGWLRLRRSTGEFKLPREKVSKLSEEALYQEKEQEYLARTGKEELTSSQRKELKEYCSKHLQWKVQYPDAEEITGVWGFLITLCCLPFIATIVLCIPYICLSALDVVPELGEEAIAFAILPLLFGGLLVWIREQVTPGAKLKPDLPESLQVYRGRGGDNGSGGGGWGGGGGGGCGGGG